MKKNKGFTLVELMVVIVIIGILAALAIPKLLGATAKAKFSEFKPTLKTIYTLQETYFTEQGVYTATASNMGFQAPTGGNFAYTLLAPTAATDMTGLELGTVASRAGKDMKTSDGAVVSGGTMVACVDGNGTQFATTTQIAKDAGNILQNGCN